jgi:hypothetical protein
MHAASPKQINMDRTVNAIAGVDNEISQVDINLIKYGNTNVNSAAWNVCAFCKV